MSKGRLFVFIAAPFVIIGLAFLGVAVGQAISTKSFLARAEHTDGTVIGLTPGVCTGHKCATSRAWYPVVRFTAADGHGYTFQSSTGSNPPSYQVGERVRIVYDPGHPSDAKIDSFTSKYVLPLVFGILGAVFTAVGIPMFVFGWRRQRLRSWLVRNGQEVWADVTYVGFESGVRINGRHPVVVQAAWNDPLTGRTYTASSDYLKAAPLLPPHAQVRVLVDPANPARNIIDLTAPPRGAAISEPGP